MPAAYGVQAVLHGWPLALTTLVLAFALVGLVRGFTLRTGMLDHPGERSSHERATPTGGGAGLVAAMVIVAVVPSPWWQFPWFWWLTLAGVCILAVVGWLDDRLDVRWVYRLFIQLGVSFALLTCITMVDPALVSNTTFAPWVMVVGGVLGLVWLMNVWNFMDGSDGMAGAQGVFCGLALAALFLAAGRSGAGQAAVCLAAASLGFLAWNLPRARIFLGDTGSVPLGLAIGSLCWVAVAGGSIPLPVVMLIPATFLVDAGMTLLWRVARGERWYTAHRNHLYQRLIRHGWSHGRVLLLYQGVNALFLAPATIYTNKNPDLAWPLAGICVMLMITAWAVTTARLGGVRE